MVAFIWQLSEVPVRSIHIFVSKRQLSCDATYPYSKIRLHHQCSSQMSPPGSLFMNNIFLYFSWNRKIDCLSFLTSPSRMCGPAPLPSITFCSQSVLRDTQNAQIPLLTCVGIRRSIVKWWMMTISLPIFGNSQLLVWHATWTCEQTVTKFMQVVTPRQLRLLVMIWPTSFHTGSELTIKGTTLIMSVCDWDTSIPHWVRYCSAQIIIVAINRV